MISRKTVITIEGEKFKINGEFTYKDRVWKKIPVEGLLFNARMVQGIFDDKNTDTVSKWAYPDTGKWDPERNTQEFIEAMPLWRNKGVLAFTINLQGGSPEGYSREQPWHNSALLEDGSLDSEYMNRLECIINRADELGMIVILGYFYFGQDQRIKDEDAVVSAVHNITQWIVKKRYSNVLVEINNECDNSKYNHSILKPERIHELIHLVQSIESNNQKLLVSASFCGGIIPADNVIESSDYILLHGNGVADPAGIERMIKAVRMKDKYTAKPILFNEDDHFNFDRETNNLMKAIEHGASWGFFDPGKNNYMNGYQSPPVNWGINTQRKRDFFNLVEKITIL